MKTGGMEMDSLEKGLVLGQTTFIKYTSYVYSKTVRNNIFTKFFYLSTEL